MRSAEAAGSLGLVLNRLFQRTFAVAKDVRTQTDIGSASISMAAAFPRSPRGKVSHTNSQRDSSSETVIPVLKA